MYFPIKDLVAESLQRFDLVMVRSSRLTQLEKNSRNADLIALLMELPDQRRPQLLKALPRSHSQLGQDLFETSKVCRIRMIGM